MNHHTISPSVVKIALDPELTAQFGELKDRLFWWEQTPDLKSSDEAPYLYFLLPLKLKPGETTYAGFSTGAPLMLERDKSVDKRAFFLRHWVRKESETKNIDAPLTSLKHLSIAAQDDILLIRVNIERPLSSEDTFKSVTLATWMFQVVQVDAVIQGKPGIRFAFALERTVTADERQLVSASTVKLASNGPKVKQTLLPQILPKPNSLPSREGQQVPIASRPARPLPSQPIVHPPMKPKVVHRGNMAYSPINPRPPAAAYQPNPYSHVSNRYVSAPMRQNMAPRPPQIQQQPVKVASRTHNRSNPNPSTSSAMASVDQLRPVMHPYLRLWEDRNLDDPDEPIFVTEDEDFDKKASRSWLVEETADYAQRFQYQKLFGVPTADYPAYYFNSPAVSNADGEADIEVVVQRKQRVKPEISELTDVSGEDDSEAHVGGPGEYSTAVVAAAEYNSVLRDERSQLRKWLVEDVGRDEEEGEEDEDDDEGEGDYSE